MIATPVAAPDPRLAGYTSEYYRELVPKGGPEAVTDWRTELLEDARTDKKLRAELREMARWDILFHVNLFGFTLDPRHRLKVMPFATWEFQNEALLAIRDSMLLGYDLLMDKSRDMGATWMKIHHDLWRGVHHEHEMFLWTSRKAELIYKNGDHKALMTRAAWSLQLMPGWANPGWSERKHYREMHIEFPATWSVIDGDAATKDFAVGDRRTSAFIDEFSRFDVREYGKGWEVEAATADVTDNRVFCGTPKGTDNAQYDLQQRTIVDSEGASDIDDRRIRRLTLHWSRHPEKSQGLYETANGRARVVDHDHPPPPDYPFVINAEGEKQLRSPWYDAQCRRRSAMDVAENLDISYTKTGTPFFDPDRLSRLVRASRPPLVSGRLQLDRQTCTITSVVEVAASGAGDQPEWRSWENLLAGGAPKRDSYGIGCDIGHGAAASWSTASVVNRRTGQKVGAVATAHLLQADFARLVVALARWYCDVDGTPAFVQFEANGATAFSKTLIGTGFRHVARRSDEKSALAGRESADKIGWWNDADTMTTLLEEYAEALYTSAFANPDKLSLKECSGWRSHRGRAKCMSRAAGASDGGAGAGDAKSPHGDRVVGDALAWRTVTMGGLHSLLIEVDAPEEERVGFGSLAWRDEHHELSIARSDDDDDDDEDVASWEE